MDSRFQLSTHTYFKHLYMICGCSYSSALRWWLKQGLWNHEQVCHPLVNVHYCFTPVLSCHLTTENQWTTGFYFKLSSPEFCFAYPWECTQLTGLSGPARQSGLRAATDNHNPASRGQSASRMVYFNDIQSSLFHGSSQGQFTPEQFWKCFCVRPSDATQTHHHNQSTNHYRPIIFHLLLEHKKWQPCKMPYKQLEHKSCNKSYKSHNISSFIT